MSLRTWHCQLALLVLTLAQVCTFAGRQVVAVLIEPIKREFLVGDALLGLVAGLGYALVYGLLALPAGRLADRADRRRMIVLSLVAWSIATSACGLAGGLLTLVVLRLLMALAESGITPPSLTLLPDIFPQRRTAVLGVFIGGSALGSLLALAFGSWMAAHHGWRQAFAAIGLPGLLLALAAAWILPEPRGPEPTRAPDDTPLLATLLQLLRDPAVRWLAVGAGFASFTTLGYVTWLPAFLVRTHGLSLVHAGLCVALIGIVTALLGSLASGWIEARLRRFRPSWTLGTATLGMCIAIVAGIALFSWPVTATIALSDSILPQALLWAAVFGFASALWTPTVFARMSEVVAPERRALANGLIALANTWIGFGLGPVVVGLLSDAMQAWAGPQALRFALIAAMCLGAISPLAFIRAARGGAPASTALQLTSPTPRATCP